MGIDQSLWVLECRTEYADARKLSSVSYTGLTILTQLDLHYGQVNPGHHDKEYASYIHQLS